MTRQEFSNVAAQIKARFPRDDRHVSMGELMQIVHDRAEKYGREATEGQNAKSV